MIAEQNELYNYTVDHFKKEIETISLSCISPIIAIRQIVKKSIEKYVKEYCCINDNPFSHDDFMVVSNRIRKEIV